MARSLRKHRWIKTQGVNHAVYEREGERAYTFCGRMLESGHFSVCTLVAAEKKCSDCARRVTKCFGRLDND
jgi:hypothetical protein